MISIYIYMQICCFIVLGTLTEKERGTGVGRSRLLQGQAVRRAALGGCGQGRRAWGGDGEGEMERWAERGRERERE